jgi:hypothetical protein
MGTSYTRQQSSNITDGSVIEASHFNSEYNQLESAFAASTGHSHDGTAGEGGYVPLVADSDANNKILVDTSNNRFGVFVEVSSSAVEQFRFQDGAIVPVTDNDIDLGTSSLEFKDAYFDGVIYTDSLALPTTTITDILDEDDMSSNSASALATQQSIKAYVDNQLTASDLDFQADSGGALAIDLDSETLTFTGGTGIDTSGSGNAVTFAIDSTVTTLSGSQTLTNKTLTTPVIAEIDNSSDITLDAGTDIILDADGGDIFFKDAGTTFGSATNSSGNLIIKSGTTTALTFSGANVTVAGDLTVSGDDITMGTNTAGNLLIADGTNFNSVAVGSLSEISTVANDDVFLAVDTSGGGLKKITRSAVVAGLATSGAISNLSEDSTPQLGGDLDVNGNDIVSVSNGNINLLPNGSGKVIMDGNGSSGGITITDGNIDIRTGTGDVSKVKFYCESSNAHAQTLQAAPHSASSSAVVVLPTASGTLVASGDSGTVTNTMLAGSIADSKLNTITTADKVSGAAVQIDGATDGTSITIADSDKLLVDDGGTTKYVNASQLNSYISAEATAIAADNITAGDAAINFTTTAGNITIDAQGNDTDIILKGTDGSSDTTFLTLDGSAAGAATFNSDVTVGALFKMPDVTAGKILVGDGTSYEEVAVSGDATLASSGALTIAATSVENSMLAGSIADSKLNTISTAGKVALTALEIDGGSDIGADLTTSDLIIVDDGAGGTNKKAALSRVVTLMSAQGFSTEDPTALAIALG